MNTLVYVIAHALGLGFGIIQMVRDGRVEAEQRLSKRRRHWGLSEADLLEPEEDDSHIIEETSRVPFWE